MKKTLVTTALASICLFANAQFSIGPKIGMGLANIKQSGTGATNTSKSGLAPTIGLEAKINILESFSVQSGLQLQILGEKDDQIIIGTKYRVRTYLSYLQVPVKFNLQYNIAKLMTVGVGVGPYVGYYLAGGIYTPDNVNDDGTEIKGKNNVTAKDPNDVAYINPLDAGLVIAPFIQVGILQIAPTFSFGISNLNPKYEGKTSTLVARNMYTGLQASFLFGGL